MAKKRSASQNGKRSRAKGHAFERLCASKFRSMGFPEAARHLEFQKDEAAKGCDLRGTGEWRVQCKAYKKYAPLTCLFEIREEVGTIPLLITKGDNLEPMACLPFWAFEQMVRLIETGSKLPSLPPEVSVGQE